MLYFREMNGLLSEPMTQGGKEMVVGQWRGMVGRLDIRDALDQLEGFSRLA